MKNITFLVAFLLAGCASEPLSFEQRQAIAVSAAAVGAGMRNFGDSMQRNYSSPQYPIMYTPTAPPPPMQIPTIIPAAPIPQTINTYHGY
jgi:hypothetical protein